MTWTMTRAEKRYDKRASGEFKQKYKKKSKFKRKTKAERRAWWYSLTDEQRQAYIEKKQAEKGKRPARESNCKVFPAITDENRHIWQEKILRLNQWLPADIFEKKAG